MPRKFKFDLGVIEIFGVTGNFDLQFIHVIAQCLEGCNKFDSCFVLVFHSFTPWGNYCTGGSPAAVAGGDTGNGADEERGSVKVAVKEVK